MLGRLLHCTLSHSHWLPDRCPILINRKNWSVIIGKTGSGKSSIILQLASILKEKGVEISLIFQNPYIYNDTLESNIFLGREINEEDREKAFELLKLFSLDFLSPNKEDLFKMKVGEHGKHLSGGQAKRLCLIRSIMSHAEFLLWDDPFSSVDVILEKEIIDRLKKMEAMKDKTLILVTHRAPLLDFVDRLLVLDNGRIVADGTKDDVLRALKNGSLRSVQD